MNYKQGGGYNSTMEITLNGFSGLGSKKQFFAQMGKILIPGDRIDIVLRFLASR